MLELKVGDKIRSYDFVGVTNCFYEGVITKIDNMGVHCDATSQCFDGNQVGVPAGKTFTTANIGDNFLDEVWTNRIELI